MFRVLFGICSGNFKVQFGIFLILRVLRLCGTWIFKAFNFVLKSSRISCSLER